MMDISKIKELPVEVDSILKVQSLERDLAGILVGNELHKRNF